MFVLSPEMSLVCACLCYPLCSLSLSLLPCCPFAATDLRGRDSAALQAALHPSRYTVGTERSTPTLVASDLTFFCHFRAVNLWSGHHHPAYEAFTSAKPCDDLEAAFRLSWAQKCSEAPPFLPSFLHILSSICCL